MNPKDVDKSIDYFRRTPNFESEREGSVEVTKPTDMTTTTTTTTIWNQHIAAIVCLLLAQNTQLYTTFLP